MEIKGRSVQARRLRDMGGGLLQQLYFAAKLYTMYTMEHANTLTGFEVLQGKLVDMFDVTPKCVITMERKFLFINDIRIRVDKAQIHAVDWLVQRFEESGIKHLTFISGLKITELKKFVPYLITTTWPEGQQQAPDLPGALQQAYVMNIKVTMRRHRRLEDEQEEDQKVEVDPRTVAAQIYAKMRALVREMLACVRRGDPVNLRSSRLVIVLASDFLRESEQVLTSLVMMKPAEHGEDNYLPAHITNVCLLSLALAARLGLDRRQLIDLGCAALVYDLGMARVPEAYRAAEEGLPPDARDSIALHPSWSANAILASNDQSTTAFQAAMVAARHHRGGPYPTVVGGKIDLFSDIVTIADAYDALTTRRPWRRALRSDEALRTLLDAEEGYDRPLVKIFANVLGVYPTGVLVELSTGEVGVVDRQSRPHDTLKAGASLTRPLVKLILDPGGMNMEGTIISLEEKDAHGNYIRSVIRVLDSEELEMGIGDMLALI